LSELDAAALLEAATSDPALRRGCPVGSLEPARGGEQHERDSFGASKEVDTRLSMNSASAGSRIAVQRVARSLSGGMLAMPVSSGARCGPNTDCADLSTNGLSVAASVRISPRSKVPEQTRARVCSGDART
jgi:hypothetical protein